MIKRVVKTFHNFLAVKRLRKTTLFRCLTSPEYDTAKIIYSLF